MFLHLHKYRKIGFVNENTFDWRIQQVAQFFKRRLGGIRVMKSYLQPRVMLSRTSLPIIRFEHKSSIAIGFLRKQENLIYSLTRFEIEQIEHAIRFYFLLPKLDKFDHVQLINSDALASFPWVSRWLYRKLFQNVKSRSLLICGDETPIIDYLLKKRIALLYFDTIF